jgi:hypothetical protein
LNGFFPAVDGRLKAGTTKSDYHRYGKLMNVIGAI